MTDMQVSESTHARRHPRERCVALRGLDERSAHGQEYEFLLRLLVDARGVPLPQPSSDRRSDDADHVRQADPMGERIAMESAGHLGRELRRRLPLAAYLPADDGPRELGMRRLRHALLERMSVMASKGLVREMLVDLHSAANAPTDGPATRLAPQEARTCREVGSFAFFQRRLLDAPDRVVARLRVAAGSGAGKAVLASMARGLLDEARRAGRCAAERRVLIRCALRLLRAAGPLIAVSAYLPSRPR